jgi:DNA polymerase III alpha subunit
MSIIPLFYDHTSGKSLLTLWDEKDCEEGGPTSIISLAKKAGLKDLFLISPNFHPFIEGMKICDKYGINFHFGLVINVTDNRFLAISPTGDKENDNRLVQSSRVIIVMKNSEGYRDLVHIYNDYATNKDGRVKDTPVYDWSSLKSKWTNNLLLLIPFWDSFVANNALVHNCKIVPDFPCPPIFIREYNTEHPHEFIINRAIDRFNVGNQYDEINGKTIYYEKESDFEAYIVYRCKEERTTFNKPEHDYLCSNKFSFETWENISKKE